MEAHTRRIQDFREHLNIVPPFQRSYEWKEEQWKRLWFELGLQYFEHVTGPATSPRPIFLGAIVRQKMEPIYFGDKYIDEHYGLIDGQQRLATLLLIAAAARDHCYKCGSDDFGYWNDDFLFIRNSEKKLTPKLKVQEIDRAVFEAALAEKRDGDLPLSPRFPDSLVAKAYDYYYSLFSLDDAHLLDSLTESEFQEQENGSESINSRSIVRPTSSCGLNIKVLKNILWSSISFVDIKLAQNEDFASEIFESLNSTGTKLSLVDKFRNAYYLLLPSEKDLVFKSYWEPMQAAHSRIEDKAGPALPTLEQFFFDESIRRFGWTPKDRTYSRLITDIRTKALHSKHTSKSGDKETSYRASVLDSLDQIATSNKAYRFFLDPNDKDYKDVRKLLGDDISKSILFLKEWDADPVRPVILDLLNKAIDINDVKWKMQQDELHKALNLLEALLVRRCAAGIPPQQLRSMLSDVPLKVSRTESVLTSNMSDLMMKYGEEKVPTKQALKANWQKDVYSVAGKAKKQLV